MFCFFKEELAKYQNFERIVKGINRADTEVVCTKTVVSALTDPNMAEDDETSPGYKAVEDWIEEEGDDILQLQDESILPMEEQAAFYRKQEDIHKVAAAADARREEAFRASLVAPDQPAVRKSCRIGEGVLKEPTPDTLSMVFRRTAHYCCEAL